MISAGFFWPHAAHLTMPGVMPTICGAPRTACPWRWPPLHCSLITTSRQQLKDALVVGISQSGQSPDIVSVLAEGRRQGCLTLAITNEPQSPLAQSRRSHPGYSRRCRKSRRRHQDLHHRADGGCHAFGSLVRRQDLLEGTWKSSRLGQPSAQAGCPDRPHGRTVSATCASAWCLGRGFNYCTAFEWALKLKELTYVVAEPYSSADFRHGPIAMVEGGFPVMAVAPNGKVFDTMLEMLGKLRHEQSAELVVISDEKRALSLAQSQILLPARHSRMAHPHRGHCPGATLRRPPDARQRV